MFRFNKPAYALCLITTAQWQDDLYKQVKKKEIISQIKDVDKKPIDIVFFTKGMCFRKKHTRNNIIKYLVKDAQKNSQKPTLYISDIEMFTTKSVALQQELQSAFEIETIDNLYSSANLFRSYKNQYKHGFIKKTANKIKGFI